MAISQDEYDRQVTELSDRMKEKERMKGEIKDENVKFAEINEWLTAFDEGIKIGKILTATDKEIMRKIVDKIVVKDDGIEIYLKCGVCFKNSSNEDCKVAAIWERATGLQPCK